MSKSVIQCFRRPWPNDPGPNFEHWRTWFPTLKEQGYNGVEIKLFDLSVEDLVITRKICDDAGLEAIASIFSVPPGSMGPNIEGPSVRDHLDAYRADLVKAQTLRPVKINAQSGADYWTVEQSVEFYKGTLEIDTELGLAGQVCHETHRSRSLFNPKSAIDILGRVPELRLTGDFSHWILVSERFLDSAADNHKLQTAISHVGHIHARVGTTNSSQCPEPTNPHFTMEREYFEKIWKECIISQAQRTNTGGVITFVAEYGPYPYHPFNSTTTHHEIADSESARLKPLFESWIR